MTNALPTKVFHGTNQRFDSFDPSFCGDNTHHPGADRAFFFAGHEGDADFYAQKASDNGRDGNAIILECSFELDASQVLFIGWDAEESGLDEDTFEAICDDDEAAFNYAEERGFEAVCWPCGNTSNANWTLAVFDADYITIH